MNQYRAKDGDRLDNIIFKAYGSIDADVTATVLDANEHLLGAAVLKAGDVVYLPEISKNDTVAQSKALW
jgi:phage tail protein X